MVPPPTHGANDMNFTHKAAVVRDYISQPRISNLSSFVFFFVGVLVATN